MPRRPQIAVFLLILSTVLTGCSLFRFMPPPAADALMGVFTEPFVCGFTLSPAASGPTTASLVRSAEGDLLTVYGDAVNTVFFHDGTALTQQTAGNADTPPLSLPMPVGWNTGAAASLALFSVPPDDSFSVSCADDGYLVTSGDGRYTAVFSHDGTPVRIVYDGVCAEITSFSAVPGAGT